MKTAMLLIHIIFPFEKSHAQNHVCVFHCVLESPFTLWVELPMKFRLMIRIFHQSHPSKIITVELSILIMSSYSNGHSLASDLSNSKLKVRSGNVLRSARKSGGGIRE